MFHEMRWTAEKIARRLELIAPLVYRERMPLAPFRWRPLAGPETQLAEALVTSDEPWPEILPDAYWGKPLEAFVLRGSFSVPFAWRERGPLALHLPLGETGSFVHPEALIYVDGTPFAACDRYHQEVQLPLIYQDGAPHELLLHGWVGWIGAQPGQRLQMGHCAVVLIDRPTRDFVSASRVALGIARDLDAQDPAHARLLSALDAAFKVLDLREPWGAAFYDSVPPALAILRDALTRSGDALDVDIVATGHAHIDVAWLWTLAQTRHKVQRTFYTALHLMEQFPDYHFTQSQPQLYEFVRQDDPALFARIQERVAEGRWEPLGGMWVEADCNVSGPESLVRQFLLGREFFSEHFGADADSPVLWLPDVFGYAWNLPQLIKQAGLEYFFTIKIGWSQYNRLPYDTFWWQGLDGTRVLTHFSTAPDMHGRYASTYNADVSPAQVRGTWDNFKQKELEQELLICFGHGDGGGGPTREMLENLHAMRDFPATPRVHQGGVGDFFRKLEADVGAQLPVWNGELYLELHRGTYTTQARSKRANRKSEFLLHDAEFLASLASVLDENYLYPARDLKEAWRLVCLNQFHDILPGSSIAEVYSESLQQYDHVREIAESSRDAALQLIATHAGGDLLLVNPTSFPRSDLVFWAGELAERMLLLRDDGHPLVTQATAQGTWIAPGGLPPYSVTRLRVVDTITVTEVVIPSELSVSPTLLENVFLRVELDPHGDIVRIYDKVNAREVLPPGTIANQLLAFEDRPLKWDAWDVDIFYDDKCWTADPAVSVTVEECGPLRATLLIRRTILHSQFEQRISLTYDRPQLDFAMSIDWRERHVLLKAAFPVDVLSPTATYEIQWGNVSRPTHRNTSWDWSRFETCAQKWVDLSEGGYGASLLNDCKYGHDIHDNVIRLSLLRAPTHPDPQADQGLQTFSYSFFPHAGGWGMETVAAAYALNDPVIAFAGSSVGGESLPSLENLCSVDQPNVVIESFKRAEDGAGYIVRLYECRRQRGWVTLRTGFDLAAVNCSDILEKPHAALPVEERQVTFFMQPYQIMTLRLLPRV